MPKDAQPTTSDTPDVTQLMRLNRFRLVNDLTVRVSIIAVLVAVPILLSKAGISKSPLLSLLSVVAVFLAILTAYRITFRIFVRKCGKVLRDYPLEFRSRVIKKEAGRTKYGTVFTLRIPDGQPGTTPLLRAVNAVGRTRWPHGIDSGVWVAGDLPFGGVIVVPSTGELLFFKPAKWEKLAPEREHAGNDRIAKAERAGLSRSPAF